MIELFDQAKELIGRSKNILILSHRKPDSDTLGSAICLRIFLKKMGINVTLACVDKPSKTFSFLPFVNEYVDNFELNEYDLLIIVDAGASYMTNFHLKYENLFTSNIPIINIDHHASNDFFGTVNIVDSEAASTTVIVYRMLKYYGSELDKKMSLCLLTGIYGDTGSFMHSNTNKEVYEISSDLYEKGASIEMIGKSMFKTNPVSTLKLWGKVLEKASITSDNVVLSVIKEEDYDTVGANPEQLSGVIDFLSMVPDVNYAVLINEDKHGNVKGSFRTRKDGIDLSRIAKVFGGGGHPKASGFSMPGKLKEELHYEIISSDSIKQPLDF